MKSDILSFYKQCLNLQEASFSRIDHEDAMVAIVFRITQPNGEQLVLKVCDRPNNYFLHERIRLDNYCYIEPSLLAA